jgi:hypothetical protein
MHPAIVKRVAAIRKGGMVSSAKRIAGGWIPGDVSDHRCPDTCFHAFVLSMGPILPQMTSMRFLAEIGHSSNFGAEKFYLNGYYYLCSMVTALPAWLCRAIFGR